MPEKEFQKFLNRSEAKTRYWRIQKSDRNFFPDAHEIFKLKFHDNIYELKVNHKDDIMTGMLYADYKFFEGNKIEIKMKGNIYVLTAKDAEKW